MALGVGLVLLGRDRATSRLPVGAPGGISHPTLAGSRVLLLGPQSREVRVLPLGVGDSIT